MLRSSEKTPDIITTLERSLIKGGNGLTREAAIAGYVFYYQSRAQRIREQTQITKQVPTINTPLTGRPRF